MTCDTMTEKVYFHLSPVPEIQRKTQALSAGNCPYRGLVKIDGKLQHIELDERCPSTIPTKQVKSAHTHRLFSVHDPEEKEEPIGWHGLEGPVDVPILKSEGHCHDCVYNMVRERELGVNVRSIVLSEGSSRSSDRFKKRHGIRKKARKLEAQFREMARKRGK